MLDDFFLVIMLVSIPVIAISAIMFFVRLITKKNRKGAKRTFWIAVACCIGSFILFGVTSPATRCEHEFITTVDEAATCTSEGRKEQYCPLCDYTKRETFEATGHNMIPQRKVEPSYEEEGELVEKCSTCGYEVITRIDKLVKENVPIETKETQASTTESTSCNHDWKEASCLTPKTCSICNETEGESLGHNWNKATCTAPKTCALCGTTEGELLPHTWVNATCSQAKTCTTCSVTDGDKLPHTPVKEWVTKSTNYIYAETVRVQSCSTCGEVVNQEILDIEKLHDDTFFLITPEDFITRLGKTLESYTGNKYTTKAGATDDSYACGVFDGNSSVSVLIFSKNNDMVKKDKRNDSGAFNKLMGKCDANAVTRVSCALIQTADPTISLDDAKKHAEQMVNKGSVSVNGITYAFTSLNGQYIIGLTID